MDASACIYMYCNIERTIMKNQSCSPGFGIQGKYLCIFVLCCRDCLFSVLCSTKILPLLSCAAGPPGWKAWPTPVASPAVIAEGGKIDVILPAHVV